MAGVAAENERDKEHADADADAADADADAADAADAAAGLGKVGDLRRRGVEDDSVLVSAPARGGECRPTRCCTTVVGLRWGTEVPR